MSSRRGLLGGLAALGAIGSGRGQAEGPPVATGQMMRAQMPVFGIGQVQDVPGPGVPDPRWDRFRELLDVEWARRRRLSARLDLTGGVPPGIAACRSWKPWFAAAAVDRWREEHMPDPNFMEAAIRRAVFGDGQ